MLYSVKAYDNCNGGNLNNYWEKSTVTMNNIKYADFCDGKKLTKFVCQTMINGNIFYNRTIECPYRCQDGACLSCQDNTCLPVVGGGQGFYIKSAEFDKDIYFRGKDKKVVFTVIVLDEDKTYSTPEEGTLVWYNYITPILYNNDKNYYQLKIPLKDLNIDMSNSQNLHAEISIDNLNRYTGVMTGEKIDTSIKNWATVRNDLCKIGDQEDGLATAPMGSIGSESPKKLSCMGLVVPSSMKYNNAQFSIILSNELGFDIKNINIQFSNCLPTTYNNIIKNHKNKQIIVKCNIDTEFYTTMNITYEDNDGKSYTEEGEFAAFIPETSPINISDCVESASTNYITKGNITFLLNGEKQTFSDGCSNINILNKVKCAKNIEDVYTTHVCENACFEGACIKPTICPSKIKFNINKPIISLNKPQQGLLNTYDDKNQPIESLLAVYIYRDDTLIESSILKIPKNGLDLALDEMMRDLDNLEPGKYMWTFNTTIDGCDASITKSFEVKNNLGIWDQFTNFVSSIFS